MQYCQHHRCFECCDMGYQHCLCHPCHEEVQFVCIGSDIVLLLCLHGYAAPVVVSKNGLIRLLMLDAIWMPLFITKASVIILHA
jgi:hypothetical protein